MPSVWPPPENLSSQTRWMNTKDWFHTRKKYTDLLVLILVLAVVLLLVLGVPYLISKIQAKAEKPDTNPNDGLLDLRISADATPEAEAWLSWEGKSTLRL